MIGIEILIGAFLAFIVFAVTSKLILDGVWTVYWIYRWYLERKDKLNAKESG